MSRSLLTSCEELLTVETVVRSGTDAAVVGGAVSSNAEIDWGSKLVEDEGW